VNLTAIDVGFNAVKCLATNDRRGHFPSVIGTPIPASGFSIDQAKKARMTVTIGDQVWPVGETALRQSAYAAGRRDPGWVVTDTWEVLLCGAFSELHRSTVTTKVVTGLPLQDWARWADPLRDVLVGAHTFTRNGGRQQTVTVADALVITQPYGSLLDAAMNDAGTILNNPFATGTVAIADIGGRTMNLLVTDALDEIGQWTQGDGLGLLKALDAIARDIRDSQPGIAPKAHEVAQWLADGFFNYRGERVDIAPFAEPHLAPVVEVILNRMSESWPEPGRYAAVLLTGGGAAAVGRALKSRMRGVYPNVIIAPNPTFGNVRGYLKLARDVWET
jgi:PRTRC genetic system protein D